jgi:predicted ATPase
MFKIVILLKRKPGMSREDFIRHYETVHSVLAVKLVPGVIDYRRNFLDPSKGVFGVSHEHPGFDCITEMVWPDKAAYERAFAEFSKQEVIDAITQDEAKLFDRSTIRSYFVDEYVSKLK